MAEFVRLYNLYIDDNFNEMRDDEYGLKKILSKHLPQKIPLMRRKDISGSEIFNNAKINIQPNAKKISYILDRLNLMLSQVNQHILPHEIWMHIFGFLDPSYSRAIMRTCQYFNLFLLTNIMLHQPSQRLLNISKLNNLTMTTKMGDIYNHYCPSYEFSMYGYESSEIITNSPQYTTTAHFHNKFDDVANLSDFPQNSELHISGGIIDSDKIIIIFAPLKFISFTNVVIKKMENFSFITDSGTIEINGVENYLPIFNAVTDMRISHIKISNINNFDLSDIEKIKNIFLLHNLILENIGYFNIDQLIERQIYDTIITVTLINCNMKTNNPEEIDKYIKLGKVIIIHN